MGRETNRQRRERQAASVREKAAAARAQQRRVDQRRRAVLVLSSVVVLAVVVALIVVIAITTGGKAAKGGGRTAASPTVVSTVTSVSPAALQSVGKGSATLSAHKTSGDRALTANGKPELLYVGGEFCPYCAAERWSLVTALSRFGTFSNLSFMHSGANDGNIATFSFYKSSYTSKYLTFTPVENADRSGNRLQSMTSSQNALFSKYTGGSYPFIDFGGKYYQKVAGYNYSDLSGLTQAQIAQQLKDPSSKVAKDILGEANNLSAAICSMTGNQPAKVCSSSTIAGIEGQLGA